jgi:hypothetical protein
LTACQSFEPLASNVNLGIFGQQATNNKQRHYERKTSSLQILVIMVCAGGGFPCGAHHSIHHLH